MWAGIGPLMNKQMQSNYTVELRPAEGFYGATRGNEVSKPTFLSSYIVAIAIRRALVDSWPQGPGQVANGSVDHGVVGLW